MRYWQSAMHVFVRIADAHISSSDIIDFLVLILHTHIYTYTITNAPNINITFMYTMLYYMLSWYPVEYSVYKKVKKSYISDLPLIRIKLDIV